MKGEKVTHKFFSHEFLNTKTYKNFSIENNWICVILNLNKPVKVRLSDKGPPRSFHLPFRRRKTCVLWSHLFFSEHSFSFPFFFFSFVSFFFLFFFLTFYALLTTTWWLWKQNWQLANRFGFRCRPLTNKNWVEKKLMRKYTNRSINKMFLLSGILKRIKKGTSKSPILHIIRRWRKKTWLILKVKFAKKQTIINKTKNVYNMQIVQNTI